MKKLRIFKKRRKSDEPSALRTLSQRQSKNIFGIAVGIAKQNPAKKASISGVLLPTTDKYAIDENDDAETRERKQLMRAFVSANTVHGLDQIFVNRNRCSQLIWFVITASVMVIVFTQLRYLIENYLTNETVTVLQVSHPDEGIKFPHLSLCLLSTINQTAANVKFPGLNKTMLEYSTASYTSLSSTALYDFSYFPYTARVNMTDIDAIMRYYDAMEAQFNSVLGATTHTQFFEETAFNCRDMFLMCWVENGVVFDCCTGMTLPNPTTTKPIATFNRYLMHNGACFEFNPMNFSQKLPGPVGGIGFVFKYPNEHLLQSAFNSHSGYALNLYASQSDAMLERSPTILPIGYHSNVLIRTTKSRRVDLDLLHSDRCRDPKLKYFDKYTYSNCQAECLVDVQLERCNCTGVSFVGRIPRHQTCTPKMALVCNTGMGQHDATTLIQRLVQCRKHNCREPCEYWGYQPSLTMSRVFNPVLEDVLLSYWQLPNSTASNQSLVDSIIIGEIYFDDIVYTAVVEKAALTLESFWSSIGGAMGFWTGASIISVVQLLFFGVLKCYMLFNPAHRQQEDEENDIPAANHKRQDHQSSNGMGAVSVPKCSLASIVDETSSNSNELIMV